MKTKDECIDTKDWKTLAKIMAAEAIELRRTKEKEKLSEITCYSIDKVNHIKRRKK